MLSRHNAALPALRLAACLTVLALLSACASRPQVSQTQEAAQYAARAKRDYTAPGPASDPWGPYIVEAAGKYDMPERWIREVMRAESSGRLYENGQLITSAPGAMGLMQVMPRTYDELRGKYGLGDDAYDPHDNIMAGAAYMRELYDLYGSPGFLAAYNAGPGRLDDYLTKNRGLPDETRNYVAKIAPRIQGSQPDRLSPATQYAMNQIPMNIPAGPRFPRSRQQAPVALADNRRTGAKRAPVQMAALAEPQRVSPPPQYLAQNAPALQPAGRGGFHLISPAMADTLPRHAATGSANWGVQVGAFANESMARSAADSARDKASIGGARTVVGSVKQGNGTLYRARLTGMSREAALQACEKLSRGHGGCMVISPDAQS